MVVLERRTANVRIIFRFPENTKCWSVISKLSRAKIIDIIEDMDVWKGTGDRLKVVVSDNGQNHNNTKVFRVDMDHDEVVNMVKQRLQKLKAIQELDAQRFQFLLKNNKTKTGDARTITFYADAPFEEVFEKVETIVQKTIEQEQGKRIIFMDEENNHGSHMWCLKDIKTGQQRCRTIRIEGYSSEELIKLISEMSKVVA